jgi:hypothetical protein
MALILLLTTSIPGFAAGLSDISNGDAVAGLKDALTQGASVAVGKLGVENGFLGNEKVKIPLPDALRRVESGLRMLGMQRQADELVTAMNHAAEQAVPEAKSLLTGAVKNMSVQDAKGSVNRRRHGCDRIFPQDDDALNLRRNSCRSLRRQPAKSGLRRNTIAWLVRALSSGSWMRSRRTLNTM